MPRKGAAQRARERQGLPPVKPGKQGWVHGSKLRFFQGHKDEFVAAVEVNKTGAFYSSIAKQYLAVYGYNTAWDADLPQGQSAAVDIDPNENVNAIDPEEAERRREYFKLLHSKISVWQLFDKSELDPPSPVKQRALHFYSNNFYYERIKPHVVTRWAAVSCLPNPLALVTIRNVVMKEAWVAETPAFRADVEQAVEKEHAAAYATAMAKETPSSAEEYSVALNNAAFYLQPFADAARRQFGLNFSILIERALNTDETGDDAVTDAGDTADDEASTTDQNVGGSTGATSASSTGSNASAASAISNGGATGPDVLPPREDGVLPPLTQDIEDTSLLMGPTLRMAPFPFSFSWPLTPPRTDDDSMGVDLSPLFRPEPPLGLGEMFSGPSTSLSMTELLEADEPLPWDELWFANTGYTEPVIGEALGAEIALLAPAARLEYMGRLGGMSAELVEEQNIQAEARLAACAERLGKGATGPEVESNAEREMQRPKPKPVWRGKAALAAPAAEQGNDHRSAEVTEEERVQDEVRSDREESAAEEERVWGADVDTMWRAMEVDEERWTDELMLAYKAFMRAKEWGGREWGFCVEGLIGLERAWGFPQKEEALAPQGSNAVRPEEIPSFMRGGRKWNKKFTLSSVVGTVTETGSFVERWWIWWACAQPEARKLPNGKLGPCSMVSAEEWKNALVSQMAGKNGMLLYVAVLLWWAEAVMDAGRSAEVLRPCISDPVRIRPDSSGFIRISPSSVQILGSDFPSFRMRHPNSGSRPYHSLLRPALVVDARPRGFYAMKNY
ncbi:hypothetical protein K438DRAFT_1961822 [Mycena galopus ATCC 62051]|nr:hypothetical protein K438DRAFT_1961822 [Mycena galopus ATCC 62051]